MHTFTKKTNIQLQTLNKYFNIFLVQNELEILENNFSKEVGIDKYWTTVILISTKKITKTSITKWNKLYINNGNYWTLL